MPAQQGNTQHMTRLHRIIPRVFTLLLFVFFSLPSSLVRGGEFTHGVLWEISKPGIPASYLFGTIHSDDPRVLRLPPVVKQAFANSLSFTGELDMNDESLKETQAAMLFPAGKTLESVIGPVRFQKCVTLMADYGVPKSIVKQMKPWAIALQLNMPKQTGDRFLDLMLYEEAVSRHIPVHALETIAEQIAVFDKLPLGQQITLLDEAIANYAEAEALIDTLIDLYLARDLAGLQAINENQLEKGDDALVAKVEQGLIVTRNLRMVERMQPYLHEGHAFIAVGALHLPGKEGLLNLLQQQGYLVKYVY